MSWSPGDGRDTEGAAIVASVLNLDKGAGSATGRSPYRFVDILTIQIHNGEQLSLFGIVHYAGDARE
jgi:hypothetical protein